MFLRNNDGKISKYKRAKSEEKLTSNPKLNIQLIEENSRTKFKWSAKKLKGEEDEIKVTLEFGIYTFSQIANSEA